VKKLIILAVVVIVGAVIADSALRSYASNQVAGKLQSALDLTKEPEVSIGGFPFLVEALSGRLESMSISARGLEKDGVTLSDVDVTLSNVRISLSGLISGKSRKARIGSMRGTASLRTEDLAAALGEPGFDVSAFDPGIVSIDGTTLSIGPTTLELPSIVEGVEYTEAELDGDLIRLSFASRRTSIEIAALSPA
jgi:hypothetical protein